MYFNTWIREKSRKQFFKKNEFTKLSDFDIVLCIWKVVRLLFHAFIDGFEFSRITHLYFRIIQINVMVITTLCDNMHADDTYCPVIDNLHYRNICLRFFLFYISIDKKTKRTYTIRTNEVLLPICTYCYVFTLYQ